MSPTTTIAVGVVIVANVATIYAVTQFTWTAYNCIAYFRGSPLLG